MELKREQIIKALECCKTDSINECLNCPYKAFMNCESIARNDALALIKELTEENENLHASCTELTRVQEENERLKGDNVIRLPLKVGDIVYSYTYFWRKEDGISPYQITNITITQNKKGIWTKKYRAMRMLDGKTIDDQLNFAFEEVGKVVFITKEEADQIAKEMLEGEQ